MKRKTQRAMKKSAELKQNISMDMIERSIPAMNMGDFPATDMLGSYIGMDADGTDPVQDEDDL